MRCKRTPRSSSRAVAMVEFALVGPLFFLLILGLVIVGIVVKNQIQLTNATRDAARAAGICGSATNTSLKVTMPDSNLPCTTANVQAYIDARMSAVDSSLGLPANRATVRIYDKQAPPAQVPTSGATNGPADLANCRPGYTVEISVVYQQPLYVPFVGYVMGDSGSNTRRITATGDATCEE